MDVYVLLGHFENKNDELLGVYHTFADAKFALDEYDRENGEFDDYSIVRRVIGAKAKWGLI